MCIVFPITLVAMNYGLQPRNTKLMGHSASRGVQKYYHHKWLNCSTGRQLWRRFQVLQVCEALWKKKQKQTKTITLYLLRNYIWHAWAINQRERQGSITYFKDWDKEVSNILIYYISELNRASGKESVQI